MRANFVIGIILLLLFSACTAQVAPEPSPTPLPSPTASATPLPSATATPAPTASATPTLTATVTLTATPLPTATLVPGPVFGGTQVPQPGAKILPDGSAGPLRELARWGRGNVEDLEWIGGGRLLLARTGQGGFIIEPGSPAEPRFVEGLLAVGSPNWLAASLDGRIEVFQPEDSGPRLTLTGFHPLFSGDGTLLAILKESGAEVYALESAKRIAALAHKSAERLIFSPPGSQLLTLSRQTISAWQISTQKQAWSAEYNRLLRVQYTPDGAYVLIQNRSAANEVGIDIRSAADGSLSGTIKNGANFVLQPDGGRLYIFSNYPSVGRIESFQLPDGKALGELRAGGSIFRLSISPDSKILAVSVPDPVAGKLVLFDGAGKQIGQVACERSCDARIPLFSPDSKWVAMTGNVPTTPTVQVGTISVYDARTGKLKIQLRSQRNLSGPMEQLSFSPDSSRLSAYSAGQENSIYSWELASPKPIFSLNWAPYLLSLGNLSADGQQAAVSDQTPASWIAALLDGSLGRKFEGASQLFFSTDGQLLLSLEQAGGRLAAMRLWKAAAKDSLLTFSADITPPLVFSPPANPNLAAVLKDGVVRILKLPGGQLTSSLAVSDKPGTKLLICQFSADGSLAAAGDGEGQVWVWTLADRKQIFSLQGHRKEITALAFAADGKILASASSDGLVKLWSLEDGKLLRTISGNELVAKVPGGEDQTFGGLSGLAFSPDGALLALSGTLNPAQGFPARRGGILLVSAADGKLIQILRGGGGRVEFSPDGLRLLASGDGAVHIFGIR